MRETLDLIAGLADRELDVTYAAKEHGDVRDTSADTTLAREQLGFSPATALEDGLEAEFEWVKEMLAKPSAARR